MKNIAYPHLRGVTVLALALDTLNQDAFAADNNVYLGAVDLVTESGDFVASLVFDDDGHAELFTD